MTTVEELQRELESVKVNLDEMLANAAVANAPAVDEEVEETPSYGWEPVEEEEDEPWHRC